MYSIPFVWRSGGWFRGAWILLPSHPVSCTLCYDRNACQQVAYYFFKKLLKIKKKLVKILKQKINYFLLTVELFQIQIPNMSCAVFNYKETVDYKDDSMIRSTVCVQKLGYDCKRSRLLNTPVSESQVGRSVLYCELISIPR